VLDFKPSINESVGMEIEFQLVDPVTFDLVDGILPLLELCTDNPWIKPEINQATVEVNSRICCNIEDLNKDVRSIVKTLRQTCEKLGMAISGGGTHPFANRLATITPLPRYLSMERRGGYLSHTLMTYAFHVHVGVTSGDEAISLMRNLRPYLPLLIAVSASSPFWWGHDSGYACYRQRVLASMRSYGIPPHFDSWKAFSDFFESARRAKAFVSVDDIHWDIRPRPDMGTLEVRVMDSQPTIHEATVLTAFVQVLVAFLREESSKDACGMMINRFPSWIDKENHFRASRHGMEADFIEDERGHTKPIKDVIENVIRRVTSTAKRMGVLEQIMQLERFLDKGPSYKQQRKVFKESGSLKEVALFLVRALDQNLAQLSRVV
jgi:carboxylate-amine ligase